MNKNSLDTSNKLITYFITAYTKKLGKKPVLNRGRLKFAIAEILLDWNQTEVKSFIDYYVRVAPEPDLSDFIKRYDEIIRDKDVEDNDIKVRKQLMNETRQSVLKFRETFKSAE
jgi:hypothetical protein